MTAFNGRPTMVVHDRGLRGWSGGPLGNMPGQWSALGPPRTGQPLSIARHIGRLAAIFDAAPIAVGVWSVDGELLHANPVLLDLMGLDRGDALGRLFEEHIRLEDAPGLRRMVGEVWQGTRNAFACDFRCSHSDGDDIWVRTHVAPVYGPTGQPEYLISQIFDFARSGDDAAAAAQVAEDSPVMLWLADDEGVPRTGNRAAFDFVGLPPSSGSLDGRALFDDVEAVDPRATFEAQRGEIAAHAPFRFTNRARRADGTERWLRHEARPVRAADGAFVGYAGASVDMTKELDQLRELEQIGELFASVTGAGPIAVLRTDALGNVTYANGRWAEILDDPETRLRETSWQSILVPEHVEELLERSIESIRTRAPFVMRVQAVEPLQRGDRPSPARHWGELRVAPVYDGNGKHDGFVATLTDVSAEVAADRRADRLAAVFDASSDFLLIVDRSGAISHVNAAARDHLGVVAAEDLAPRAEPHLLLDVLEAESFAFFQEVVTLVLERAGIWRGELTLRDRDGGPLPVSALALAQGDAPTPLDSVSIVARDVSDLKDAERRMRELATHDYLTGLPNRILLYDRLELALARFERFGQPVSLLFLDLDRFKPINDGMGHHVGDEVLVVIADRISEVLRETDTAARLGGDEFAVLTEGIGDHESLGLVARRLIDTVSAPIRVDGGTVTVGVSVGIVVASPTLRDVDALVVAADRAMYEAKAAGGACWKILDL